MIIYVFNFTIRSFVFHVGHWNNTLKTYNQFFSIKNNNFNTNILQTKFYVKEPFVPSKRGGGVRIGWEETTSKNIIKKILTHVNIYICIHINYMYRAAMWIMHLPFPLSKQTIIYPPWAQQEPKTHKICPIKAHFLVPNGAYDQEGDFLPSPRWIKCTIPTWPMGRMLMFC